MVRHPSTGQNLLMAGADLLDAPTGTAVAQRSEAGQGILGAKEGKGMWVWSGMVLAVLSSRMSAGGYSLAGLRDNVPCLAITAIFSSQNSYDVSREKLQNSIKTTRFKMENTKFSRKFLTSYLENEVGRILQIFFFCASGD
jgi:hypothetical protein